MKHLTLVNNTEEYEALINSGVKKPHVVYIKKDKVIYLPYIPTPPLYFSAVDNMTVTFTGNDVEYSLDNKIWEVLPSGQPTPTISSGNKVYFRATGLTANSSTGIGTFSMTGKCNVGGSIMSMLYGEDFEDRLVIDQNNAFRKLFASSTIVDASLLELPATTISDYCYAYLFSNCKNLVAAPKLPADNLPTYCYFCTFSGCTSLVTAPELPATTLSGTFCYYSMFSGCSNLKNAPAVLPATKLSSSCYYSMFQNCTSLVTAPELPATKLSSSCYYSMFSGCSNLENAPELPATTLATSCYNSMFKRCVKLVNAPILSAVTLVNNCYSNMFYECSQLAYIKALFKTTPGSSYTNYWVYGVASTGTFVKNSAATWNSVGSSGSPSGWTIELAAA